MNVKEKTHNEIFKFKKGKPLNYFLKVARCMLTEKGTSPLIRGELGECVLIVLIQEYIKAHPDQCKDWILSQGLILSDLYKKDCNNKYLTELDVTLFTPKRIYLFECKSYKGKKVLTGKGFLNTVDSKGNLKPHLDVWDQHFKHFQALLKYVSKFLLVSINKVKPFKIIFFDFSKGEIIDKRDSKSKKLFPVYDETNLFDLFNDYNSLPDCWEMSYVKKVVSLLNAKKENLTTAHLHYVRGLNHNKSTNK